MHRVRQISLRRQNVPAEISIRGNHCGSHHSHPYRLVVKVPLATVEAKSYCQYCQIRQTKDWTSEAFGTLLVHGSM